ncbi:MAG: hypothetical protein E6779_07360, partial [Finegoldia magna]|nr:hypothetical protein [Finegoldia magna]
ATVQFKQDLSQAKDNQLSDKMKSEFGNSPQINTVSPLIGQELAKNAMLALVYAALGIISYLSLRFEWRMGLSSVLALLELLALLICITGLFFIKNITATAITINETTKITFDLLFFITISFLYSIIHPQISIDLLYYYIKLVF